MAQENTPVHLSAILPGLLSQLKQTSRITSSPEFKGTAQSSVPYVSPLSSDRESFRSLTIRPYGVKNQIRVRWYLVYILEHCDPILSSSIGLKVSG